MLWSIGQFPELDHLDPIERAAVLRRVPWYFYLLIIAISLIGGFVVWMLGVVASIILQFKAGYIAAGALAILVSAILYFRQLNRVRAVVSLEIANAFKGQRPPFCFNCGYDFRNLTSDSCPECGQRISQ